MASDVSTHFGMRRKTVFRWQFCQFYVAACLITWALGVVRAKLHLDPVLVVSEVARHQDGDVDDV